MTEEVGAITGDLELATRLEEEGVFEVRVRYAEAEEWFVVEGSPIEAGGTSELDELHERIIEY